MNLDKEKMVELLEKLLVMLHSHKARGGIGAKRIEITPLGTIAIQLV